MTDETVDEWRARTQARASLPLDDIVWPEELPKPPPHRTVAARAEAAPAPADVLVGADISHHQGDIDVARLGVAYLWAKATEVGFVDGKFARNRQAAARARIPFGSYSFLRPGQNVAAAVRRWHDVAGPARPGDLRPALDIEVPGFTASEIRAYVGQVLHEFGCLPVAYIAQSIYRQPGMAKAVEGCPLWVPRYGGLPQVPWDVHQFTDAMRTPAGSVDGNHTTRLEACLVPGAQPDPPHPTDPPTEDDMYSDQDRQTVHELGVAAREALDRLDRLERRLLRQVADEHGVVYLTDGISRVWVPDEAWRGQLADAFRFGAPERWDRAGISKIPLVGPEAPGVAGP